MKKQKFIIEILITHQPNNALEKLKKEENYPSVVTSLAVLKIVGIHRLTLLDWRKKGKIKFFKVAGKCFYKLKDVYEAKQIYEQYRPKKNGGTK